MSHFTVAVVLPEYSEQALKDALQPYHEYECTGVNDQYVVKVESSNYSYQDYLEDTLPCVVDKTTGGFFGTTYDDKVKPYWKRDGIGFSSRDELLLPDHLIEKELPAQEVYPEYTTYLKDWCGVDVEGDYYTLEDGKLYTFTNPNAKWDCWQIGGRWCGHFKMKPKYNMVYDDRQVAREKGYMKGDSSFYNEDKVVEGYDIIRKGDIDLETGFEEKFHEQLKHFEIYLDVAKQYPDYKTWDEFTKDGFTQGVREAYWSQPILKELESRLKTAFPDSYGWSSPKPETFCNGDYEAFKNKVRYQLFGTYAILQDDNWMQKGEMGWFGCDSNVDSDWETKWFEIFDSIPDDHWIVVVDCHI